MQKGAPRAALPLLEELVTDHPAQARFRLELARALYLTREDYRARYHFEYAMAGELSLSEINAVQSYLTAIETRKSWSGQARIAVVPQSNPWQRSGQAYVDVGGALLLPLPQVERATGLELALGGTWLPRVAPDLHGRVHVVATGHLFEDSQFNRGHFRGEFGFVQYGDHGRVYGLGVSVQGAGGREGLIMKGAGIYGAFQQRFGRRTQVSVSATYDELRYPSVPKFNGPRGTFSLGVQHIVTSRLKLSGALSLSHHHTDALFHRRTDGVVSAQAEYAMGGGLITGLEASLGRTEFVQANPLLAQYGPQKDWKGSLTASFMHRDYTVRGFAPVVKLGVERQTSTVPMYSFDNVKMSLGATRNF